MFHIVLTGGPSAGKSQSLSKVFKFLTEKRNWNVFIVPETATELLANGIRPCEQLSLVEFQNFVLDKQLAKDQLYGQLSNYFDTNKTVIIYDRGIMDQLAYCTKSELENMLKRHNLTIADVMNKYDCVIHMVTAADGAEEFYEWNGSGKECKNAVRSESPEEARIADKKTLNAWVGHPHLRVVDNSTDFSTKVNKVIQEICSVLGEPVPMEIERKYLIKMPSKETLDNIEFCSKNSIIQTYLKSEDGVERRVRQRGTKEDGYNFYYTEKKSVANGTREENEYKITQQEYTNYLMEADIKLHQISKERYCFVYKNQYFEMDIYPFSEEYAIVEIELNSMEDKVELPPFLDIVKEVTDEEKYKNYSLAKTLSF